MSTMAVLNIIGVKSKVLLLFKVFIKFFFALMTVMRNIEVYPTTYIMMLIVLSEPEIQGRFSLSL